MLVDLITYLAEDGDLLYPAPVDFQTDIEADISANVGVLKFYILGQKY